MEDQIAELKAICENVSVASEGGTTYFLLEGFKFPENCSPGQSDLLLCPTPRDGYPSRVFFADRVTSSKPQNWHATPFHILGRNWHVFSWKLEKLHTRLMSILNAHLKAL